MEVTRTSAAGCFHSAICDPEPPWRLPSYGQPVAAFLKSRLLRTFTVSDIGRLCKTTKAGVRICYTLPVLIGSANRLINLRTDLGRRALRKDNASISVRGICPLSEAACRDRSEQGHKVFHRVSIRARLNGSVTSIAAAGLFFIGVLQDWTGTA